MKDIKLRIKSVESTMQITKAMELVASSKLRHAKEQVEKSRPYFNIIHETMTDIATSNREFSSPFTVQREVKKTCFVVIMGDRGLAGGFNSNVLKLAQKHMEGKPCCVLPIGKKAVDFFERRGYELLSNDFAEAQAVRREQFAVAGSLLANGFLKGDFDRLCIVYTNFVSMLSQDPAMMEILPIFEPKGDNAAAPMILYEPSAEEVFDAIVPGYIAGIIYGALSESLASELSARRMAMDAASKNASDMIEDLSLKYNRARQGTITQEITEIVAGAE